MLPLVAAGIGAAGGLASAAGSYFGAREAGRHQVAATESTNRMNLQISREDRAWQETLANSAHQREVEDLKKAGLNPILSASKGGAVTPTPHTPTMQAPDQSYRGKALAELGKSPLAIMNSAMSMSSAVKELAHKDEQINATVAQTKQANAGAELTSAQTAAVLAGMPKIGHEILKLKAESEAAQAKSSYDVEKYGYEKKFIPFDSVSKRVREGFGTITDALMMKKGMEILKDLTSGRIMRKEKHLRDQGIHGTELP